MGWDQYDRPARTTFDITPDDANNLPRLTRQLVIGVAGNIKVDIAAGGRIQTKILPVQAGTYKMAVSRVYATGTTATAIAGVA
jgi:hypothetical protein